MNLFPIESEWIFFLLNQNEFFSYWIRMNLFPIGWIRMNLFPIGTHSFRRKDRLYSAPIGTHIFLLKLKIKQEKTRQHKARQDQTTQSKKHKTAKDKAFQKRGPWNNLSLYHLSKSGGITCVESKLLSEGSQIEQRRSSVFRKVEDTWWKSSSWNRVRVRVKVKVKG